ncbi:UNVERIFIED_CONTAM: hypothetical protein Slati_0167200 [Sesamum latifolium]|uniref:Uncharacterized protein n=1 Tax=Sesamum latifolium TaxID=2727402 RepID=A0AAW2YAP7_9LAMI
MLMSLRTPPASQTEEKKEDPACGEEKMKIHTFMGEAPNVFVKGTSFKRISFFEEGVLQVFFEGGVLQEDLFFEEGALQEGLEEDILPYA